MDDEFGQGIEAGTGVGGGKLIQLSPGVGHQVGGDGSCVVDAAGFVEPFPQASVPSMEFKKFVNAFVRVPVQMVRAGRRILFRLLSWNPWKEVFLRAVDHLRAMSTLYRPLRC